MTNLRYPIGKYQSQDTIADGERKEFIRNISEAPAKLRQAIHGLSPSQLDTPYREGGWTVKQVVHHLPDSHLNAYIRMKLALTEDKPAIKAYQENLWAELYDARMAPIETSLLLLESLHKRWVMLLESLPPEAFARPLLHPEHGVMKIDNLLHLYSWHGRHHVAQITSLRERMGWK